MLAFPVERLVFLCTPKSGSSSVEEVYGPYAGGVLGGHPRLTHVDLATYERGLASLLGDDQGMLETVCLIRDPLEQLRSWYRYLLRPDRKRSKWFDRDWSFEDFVAHFLGAEQGCRMKTQHEFVQDETGEVGVNRIFALERVDRFVAFMNERLTLRVRLPVLNASKRIPTTISSGLEAELRQRLASDFELHGAVLEAEEGWQNPVRGFESRPAPGEGVTASWSAKAYRRRAKAVRWSPWT
ncbi:MAG: hypothetical protein P8I44_08985 [Phycisphaerales bacterium]|nr:hypothetical protein [Phycisphaerales bacterium]